MSPSASGQAALRRFLAKALALAAASIAICASLSGAGSRFDPEAWPAEQHAAIDATEGRGEVGPVRVDRRVVEELLVPLLTQRFDVLVLGSSAAARLDGSLFPGRSFHNGWVPYALLEDVLLAYERYLSAELTPRTLVVTLTPEMLLDVDQSELDATSYRSFPERVEHMRAVLGEAPPAPSVAQRVQRAAEVLSLARLRRALSVRLLPRPPAPAARAARGTEEAPRPPEETVAAGTERHRRAFAKILDAFPDVDASRLARFERFLAHLDRARVEAILVLSPLSPGLHHALTRYPLVAETERRVRALAATRGVRLVGSFDPARAGCAVEQFNDGVHWRRSCARILFGAHAQN